MIPVISPKNLFDLRNDESLVLIDVREQEEFDYTKIPKSILIPLGELEFKITELQNKYLNSDIIIICRSGQRSAFATKFMQEKGFLTVRNLEGGILEYSRFDDTIKTY